MTEIRKATENDLLTIHKMAQVVFRHTYRDILSSEQMEYMMDMMYSMPNLQKQLEEGHHYYIAYMSPAPVIGTGHEDDPDCGCNDGVSGNGSASAVCEAQASAFSTPCGYVSVQYEGPEADGIEIFHLHKIYVMPDAQGRGVGLKLFQTVVDHVRGRLSESDTAGTTPFTAGTTPYAADTLPDTTGTSPLPEPAPLSRKARIELNVNKFNSAVNFYRHLGMRVLLEEDFPIGNGFYKTDYIMGLDI